MGEINDFSNFAMIMPSDVLRHPDGTPVLFIKHKTEFLDYCEKVGIDLDPLTVQQRESIYRQWEPEFLKNNHQ